jgi:uncharacterized membrane protein YhiD involved in acid resistance
MTRHFRSWIWLAAVLLQIALAPFASRLAAASPRPDAGLQGDQFPMTAQTPLMSSDPLLEVKKAVVRLPYAAILGTVLALRPRRKGQGRRNILVVQTQIILSVVGAVVMLVVGDSTARAFGIVGAAGLVRYRSTIDDPKEAVVMLCALSAGLACGVGLYVLAPFATVFMTVLLWIVEYFEPPTRKAYELKISTKDANNFRPKAEDLLIGLKLDFELLSEGEDELGYSVLVPLNVKTRDVSDTLKILSGDDEISIEWEEKKSKK